MPTAAGFPALFEVAATSVALTIACIGGCRYTARCLRSSSPLHLSGLAANLLTLFFSVYGLTYWLNGPGGYSCAPFSTAMGTALSASTAATFVHLFMLSDSLNETSNRWKYFRLLGLVITTIYCGSLVAVEVTRTAWEKGVDEGGSQFSSSVACMEEGRCVSEVDNAALMVKWIAQLLNQIFQAAAVLVPLRGRLERTARSRFFSDIFGSTGNYRKGLITPVWLFIVFESVSLAVTTVVASLMLANARGRLDSMPTFAVEVLDNATNLVVVFFSVEAMSLTKHLQDDPKHPQRLFHGSALAGTQPHSMSGTFPGSASSLGNDSSGASQPYGVSGRFAANGCTGGSSSLSGNGFVGYNGGRVGSGSGYRIRRRPDGSLAGSYDGRGGGYGPGGRMGGRGGGPGNLGTAARRPRRHSIGVVSATPAFSSFSSSSLQRRRNSESFVRRLPPLMDMSPEGHDMVDSNGSRSRSRSRSQSRSRSKSSSSSSRSPPVCAPSPSSPPPTGVPSPIREEAVPVAVSPSTSATPPPADGAAETDVDRAEAVAARANGSKGSSSGRQGRPLGTLYFSSRAARSKSRSKLIRSESSGKGDRSSAGDAAMQNRAASPGSASGPPTPSGCAGQAAAEGDTSARSVSPAAPHGQGAVASVAVTAFASAVGVNVGGLDASGGTGGGTGGGGGADDGGGCHSVRAITSNIAPARSSRGLTSATSAAATHDLDATANTQTVITLTPWKWQGQEHQDQERQQALPRPRPTHDNKNNHNRYGKSRIRPHGSDAARITDAGERGRERRDEAPQAPGGVGHSGIPTGRTMGPPRVEGHRETIAAGAGTAASAALAVPGVTVSAQGISSGASRQPRKGMASDAPHSASPEATAAAAAAAAHTVVWPLALKDVSSSDSFSLSPPGGERRSRFTGVRLAAPSSQAAQGAVEERKENGAGVVGAAVPGWARRQGERHKKQAEAIHGKVMMDPAAPVGMEAAPAARGAGPSSYLSGTGEFGMDAATSEQAAGAEATRAAAAAASTADTRGRPEWRSSSGTCRSGVSGVARSAFSEASWFSISFGGDNALQEGAPSSTMRSPASYFTGNCDDS
ncbi:unnamed protein product [Scytosiphon promiscuus]